MQAYLLLDASASMAGAPIQALKQAVNLLCGTFISLGSSPIHVGMISYDSTAREIGKLGEATACEVPKLEPGGSSALGGALRKLDSVIVAQETTLAYVFTDGEPTDDWEVALPIVRPRLKRIYGIVCKIGPHSPELDHAFDRTFTVRELTTDLLFETFRAYQ